MFLGSRRFGTKCGGCSEGISPSDLVRRAQSKVFHLGCFTCVMCNKQLSTGEELYVLDELKFICKEDYHNSQGRDTVLLSGGTRTRTRNPNRFVHPGRIALSWGLVANKIIWNRISVNINNISRLVVFCCLYYSFYLISINIISIL